jgi:hypothetical protein
MNKLSGGTGKPVISTGVDIGWTFTKNTFSGVGWLVIMVLPVRVHNCFSTKPGRKNKGKGSI